MNTVCQHGFVNGRVQGVSFRQFTKQQADAAGLNGWVRNLADGRVEFLLCGEASAVSHLLDLLHRGPLLARVDSLESRAIEAPQVLHGFRITG